MSTYTVPDGPKALRETLSLAQTALFKTDGLYSEIKNHADRLQRLIDECERKRLTGFDGTHGDRHTPECGCEAGLVVEDGRDGRRL